MVLQGNSKPLQNNMNSIGIPVAQDSQHQMEWQSVCKTSKGNIKKFEGDKVLIEPCGGGTQ